MVRTLRGSVSILRPVTHRIRSFCIFDSFPRIVVVFYLLVLWLDHRESDKLPRSCELVFPSFS